MKRKSGMKGIPVYGSAKSKQKIGPGMSIPKVKKEKLQKPRPLK